MRRSPKYLNLKESIPTNIQREAWSILRYLQDSSLQVYSYNKSQRDALFLKFILVKNYKRFGQTYCPSSGVLTLYSQQYVFVILVMLTSAQNLLSSSLLSKNLKIKVYRTIILPVVLYGCETWSLTLREERRLRVFENRILRRIFGPKRDEVTGE